MNSLPEAALWIFHINRDTTLDGSLAIYDGGFAELRFEFLQVTDALHSPPP